MVHALDEVGRVSDVELVRRIEQLVRVDRATSAKLIVHLGEVDVRDLHREHGFSSMFEYCRGGLGMSEGEAALRILAARVGRRFPLVVERLGSGDVNLTGIRLLAPLLTEENHVQLLDRVRGMTKRQIEVLIAELAPKPDVPARMRKLPEVRAQREANTAAASAAACNAELFTELNSAATTAAGCGTVLAAGEGCVTATSAGSCSSVLAVDAPSSVFGMQPSAAPVRRARRARATLTPLSPGRFDLRLTVGQEAHDALGQLVELLRHQNPSGDMTSIVERALCELLKREMKRRFGQTDANEQRGTREPARAARSGVEAKSAAAAKPDIEMNAESLGVDAKAKRQVGSAKSRYVPVAVRREVHARDNGQCTFVSEDGRRCTERGLLEVHHHNTTFARGGEATADNLRLMCRAHNMFHAHRDYGRAFLQNKLIEAAARKQLSLVPGQYEL